LYKKAVSATKAIIPSRVVCGALSASMLLAAAQGAPAAPMTDGAAWRRRAARAVEYAQQREGSVTFAVVAPSGRLYRQHARTRVPAASVLKVMFMTAYLRQKSVRNRTLRRADKDLLRPMIRRSDNDSATTIADRLGPKPMNRLARRAGMKDFSYTRPWGLSTISAQDQALFMSELKQYIPKRHERYARWLLSHIIKPQRWGVAKVAPSGWRLFFKSGWGTGTGRVGHQVAFLERGDRRVALAITTEFSPSHAYSKRTLRGVAARLLRGL
jgi:beta-lactamase class A